MDHKLLSILLLAAVIGAISAGDSYTGGYWSPWSRWATCNVYCGGGTQSRARHCRFDGQGPPGDYGCTEKISPDIQRRACNTQCCPVDGHWSSWSSWSYVSGSQVSNYYLRKRTRTCTNPPPSCGGRYCYGDSQQIKKIYAQH
ncbi:ectin-like [Watersipora subatra]|uniref:ectin-like n=1 Tax=Watersipora subatra TaxID=2589382 RepID=UPI00355BD48C